jgi:polysaccharide biosynthesis protein PslH
VDLFTLADEAVEAADRKALERYCRRVVVARLRPGVARVRSLRCMLSRKPLTLPYFQSAELQEEIRRAILLRGYDRVFVYSSAMAQYVNWVRDIPVITDLVDVDSDKWSQYAAFTRFPADLIYKREGKRLREYERSVCNRSHCVIVTTEREAKLVREISPGAAVQVIGNGVDVDFFRRPNDAAEDGAPAIVFTGDMSYFPNEDAVASFVSRIFPLVRQAVPGVRFLIVGRNPTARVRRLAKVAGVEVTGSVPDVRPWLARAKVAVAPFSIATGIQNKILEALAYGLPVVASDRALQGLSGRVAEIVQHGGEAAHFAATVVSLLQDARLAREIGMEGRRRVSADYSWSTWDDRLLALVEGPAPASCGRREPFTGAGGS